jgi:predicted short-subunit dehydrogenase-like oxidoreductase (DUF2520 family)
MNITLIGAGNLATNLGKALKAAQYHIGQVYSRTETSARQLGELLDCPWTTTLSDLADDADCFIISVKDNALEQVAEQVCRKFGNVTPQQAGGQPANDRKQGNNHLQDTAPIFLHTAGSMPIQLFEGRARRYGVLYPMQTFSKEREVDLSYIPCFVEANDEATMAQICQLARSISKEVHPMSSADRRYLHLAAVWACNFTNHCYDVASEILGRHDIPFSVMNALVDETAAKVHALPPRQAQTGPAVRFDENVLEAQMKLMEGELLQQELYRKLSESIHEYQKKVK